MIKPKVLIIDDEKLLRWSLNQNLTNAGYSIIEAADGTEGIKRFNDESPDIVLLDIHLPDISGINVLEKIKSMTSQAIVIMITAYGDIQTAVKTIKLGAYDFVEKPFNMEKLNILLEKATETISLRREVKQLKDSLADKFGFDNIIGQSDEMLKVFDFIKKILKSDTTTVLLQGESGTGKDLVAKVIHYQSVRSEKPFMEINCTALPETLIESELFGFEKGAFTDAKAMKKGLFELADGGTIFLDEIGDMKLSTQAKLLKVLENKSFKRIGGIKDIEVNIRIIAATNKRLDEEVKLGNFREDLFYRLKVIPLTLPALREKPSDIPILSKYFIDDFNNEFKKNVKGLSKDTEARFMKYHWPGNVRELKNVIERAMILESEEYILSDHLPSELMEPAATSSQSAGSVHVSIPEGGIDIEEVERELIKQALDMTKGNQTRAAKQLNLSRDALRYRMQKFNLMPEKK
ncbi:MAG: sigma-54-dependent Fis family transcriptional regulator [Nitrospirota bacterium]|nr:MAG: sigma-54-dependent Fis family transcriptional regulator [Nitrospirota bacterium]